jgi:Tfp pilus assembly protein PilO
MNFRLGGKLPPKQKIIISTGITCLIIGVLVMVIILPSIAEITDLRDQIISQKIDLEKKLKKENNMAKLGEQLKKIKPEMKRFDQMFVKDNNKLEFITTLEGMAENHNVDQTLDIQFNKKEQKNRYSIIPVNLLVKGNFNNLMSYLSALEKSGYTFNINSITMSETGGSAARSSASSGKEPGSTGNMTMTLSAHTFWR